jgi:hypothetical protein
MRFLLHFGECPNKCVCYSLYVVSYAHLIVPHFRYLKNLSTLFLIPNLSCIQSSLSNTHLYYGPLSTITNGLLVHMFNAFLMRLICSPHKMPHEPIILWNTRPRRTIEIIGNAPTKQKNSSDDTEPLFGYVL